MFAVRSISQTALAKLPIPLYQFYTKLRTPIGRPVFGLSGIIGRSLIVFARAAHVDDL